MNSPLINKFTVQIKALSGFDFQDFIVELFLLIYGATGFTVLRRKSDKGCDGIIVSEKQVIACYGPINSDQRKFDKKAEDDFDDYKKNWQSQFPNWMFVVNYDVTPAQIEKIESLKKGTPLLGIKQILALIDELDGYKKRKLAKWIKIESEYLAKDYLSEILDDLLKNSFSDEPRKPYTKPVYISDKIKLNFSEEETFGICNEFESVSEYFSDINGILEGYEDEEMDRIKYKLKSDFDSIAGVFKNRLDSLTRLYLSRYSTEEDDDYRFYIRALLIYIFEQCLIGNKTTTENDTWFSPVLLGLI